VPSAPGSRAARALLAVAAVSLAAALGFAALWWRALRYPEVDRLSVEQRQRLVGELVNESPGLYVPAYFEPRLGYVLRPQAELTAWGTSFRSNTLGFRAPPPHKRPGTQRLLFVGDSWTFGMGVTAADAYPARVAELANQLRAGGGRRVEAWTLALPGWNTFNQVAAVEYFLDRLQPDVVIAAPTMNDVDSTPAVLPNGALTHLGASDAFGDPHVHVYRVRLIDSYVYQRRWRQAMGELRRLEGRLAARGVPLLLFFTGRWQPTFARRLMAEGGLTSRYLVLPLDLAGERWLLPVHGHPRAEAHARHADLVYSLLATRLGWPGGTVQGEGGAGPLAEAPSASEAIAAARPLLARMTERQLEESWRPSADSRACVGDGLDCARGILARAATIVLRRAPSARTLEVVLGRLDGAPGAYPMRVEVAVPAPGGGARAEVMLAASGDPELTVTVPLPDSICPGQALDLVIVAERAVAGDHGLLGRSARVLAVRQR
jgi:hypothetical protein